MKTGCRYEKNLIPAYNNDSINSAFPVTLLLFFVKISRFINMIDKDTVTVYTYTHAHNYVFIYVAMELLQIGLAHYSVR